MKTVTGVRSELRQFDFWLGSWELSWEPDGQATNEVMAILDDTAILERFDGRPSIALQGVSLSLYDRDLGAWRQTWVDNDGRYLDFSGGMKGERMVLERRAADGMGQRMVWFDIETESLRWNWERSLDDSASWEVLWAIRYRRRRLDVLPLERPSS